jgi:diguanylate cyclase (GGDEF)-like protein
LSERVIQDGQARATNVGDADLNVRGALLAAGIHSLAVVPLSVADSVVGVLGVGSEEPDRFGEAELRWLNAVGNTIAVALENARLYQSAVQAAERRETLHWLGQEIVGASLDPERVYLATHRAAAKLMPSEAFAIAILDELRQEIEAVYLVDRSGRCPKQRIPMARGLSGRVVSTGQPLLIDDFDQVSDRLDTVHFGDPTHVRSILAVPMRLGGKIFGMLSAQSYTPRAYTIEDLNVLEMLAAHAAIALDNARLFEAEQRRRESAQALLEIAVASASNLDLLQTLRQIALQTARACRVNRCSIFLLDATGENLKPIMSQFANGHTDWEQWQRFRQTPPEPVVSSPVFAQPMRDQKPVVVESAQQVARLPSRWIEPFGIRRLFAVPLVSRGRAIGLMVLDDVESEEPFTAEQIDLATTIGAQVTAAIENARLFEAVQRQAEEAETLRQAGSVVVATLQPEEAIARILQQLARVVPYDSASVQLLRDGYVEIVGGRGWPDLAAVLGMRFPVPGDNPNTVVIQQRKPYILEKAPAAHAPFREEPHSHIQSWLGVPLIVHDQVIGMLAVDSTQPSYFTDDHARLASAFANQVAIALENVRLSETARQNAAELEAVRQATLSLTKSLDLHQVLDAILENALRLMAGAKDAHIFLYAAERGGHLTFGASRWYDGRTGQPWAMPRPQGLTITVARQGQAIVVPDMSKHPLFSDAPPPWRTGAIVGLPLKIGERVVGVMNVAYALAHAFSESELRMLRLLGDQAAIAIENARLFESVERRVAQLATLREIDRGLSAMLNFAPMLETMLSHLGQIVPYDSAAVFLLDDHSLRAVAARGRDQTALAQFALDASDSAIFHQMAQTRAPIVFDDLGEHPEWVAVPGMEWARAWIGVPLIARGEMIGQIGVFSATPHAFTREHSDLLLAFANHAAIAIANARLHAELNEQARRDSLTQVLNHGAFVTELRAAGEQGEPLALIMLDLDNFKQYNDTYGHTVGDAVLCATVHAIRAHVKHTDFVGRWGGEEFAIALRGADTARAARVATRIRATLAATPITDRQGNAIPPPTASQGIAALPGTARDVDDLIENADRALYRAKARGRDQVACAE